MCVFNRRKAEKLRSADADVAGITSDNFTKRTTSVSNYTFILSSVISVTVERVDVVKRFLNISSCADSQGRRQTGSSAHTENFQHRY